MILKIFPLLPHLCENSYTLREPLIVTGNLRHRDPCNKESTPFLWILSPSWFEETGRSHKTSFDAYPLARSLPLFLFQNHPPSWGFLSQERHLSTRVLTHQRVGKKRTGRSGSCKAKEYLFPGDWAHPHPTTLQQGKLTKGFYKMKESEWVHNHFCGGREQRCRLNLL